MDTEAIHITVDDHVWREENGGDNDTRLHTTVRLNGVAFHLEAWPVQDGADPQELDGAYPEMLDALCEIYTPDGHFQTVHVRGRECVIVRDCRVVG
jgi:hypothetical protein